MNIFDIDDTFCVAHGGQQLAFWMPTTTSAASRRCTFIMRKAGTPLVSILRTRRTPKGSEVRTVIKHVTQRPRKHWGKARIIWRGDGHYGHGAAAMDANGAGRCRSSPILAPSQRYDDSKGSRTNADRLGPPGYSSGVAH